MKSIELIAKKARSSLTEFCIKECKAYCCRKGYLLLSDAEKKVVLGNNESDLEKEGYLMKTNGKTSFFIGNHNSCTALDKETCLCKIYNHKLRLETCRHFPVFIDGDKVIFSERCLAVKEGKMYPFEKELIKNKIEFEKKEFNSP